MTRTKMMEGNQFDYKNNIIYEHVFWGKLNSVSNLSVLVSHFEIICGLVLMCYIFFVCSCDCPSITACSWTSSALPFKSLLVSPAGLTAVNTSDIPQFLYWQGFGGNQQGLESLPPPWMIGPVCRPTVEHVSASTHWHRVCEAVRL